MKVPIFATEAQAAVLTALPIPVGGQVVAGGLLAQISGRPVLAFPGAFPSYRDIFPGSTGADVSQLQAALAAMGVYTGTPTGVMDGDTQKALSVAYSNAGYSVPTTAPVGSTAYASIKTAEQAVVAADRKLAADVVSSAAAARSVDAAQAKADLAYQSLSSAKTALQVVKSQEPALPDAVQTAREAVSTQNEALADTLFALQAAKDAAQLAEAEVGYDRDDIATANQILADLQTSNGVYAPVGEIAYIPSLPLSIGSFALTVGQVLEPGSDLLTLVTGRLQVQGILTAGQHSLVKEGDSAVVFDTIGQRSISAAVSAIGSYSAPVQPTGETTGQVESAGGFPVTLSSDDLGQDWVGVQVRLTIETASTGVPVLVVPAVAIASGPTGQTFVRVVKGDGSENSVDVAVGAVVNGEAQVKPTGVSLLRDGDEVVVSQ